MDEATRANAETCARLAADMGLWEEANAVRAAIDARDLPALAAARAALMGATPDADFVRGPRPVRVRVEADTMPAPTVVPDVPYEPQPLPRGYPQVLEADTAADNATVAWLAADMGFGQLADALTIASGRGDAPMVSLIRSCLTEAMANE